MQRCQLPPQHTSPTHSTAPNCPRALIGPAPKSRPAVGGVQSSTATALSTPQKPPYKTLTGPDHAPKAADGPDHAPKAVGGVQTAKNTAKNTQ